MSTSRFVKIVVSILVGSILGIIASRYLFVGSGLSLIPWAIVGLVIGYWSEKPEWWINGPLYGFFLAFVFMVAGYTGSAPWTSRLFFFAILGVVGAICGLVLGLLGYLARERVFKR